MNERLLAREIVRLLGARDACMNKKQVAEYLGVGVTTVESYMKEGLPHFLIEHAGSKRSKLVRFRRSEVDGWLERFRVKRNKNLISQIDEILDFKRSAG